MILRNGRVVFDGPSIVPGGASFGVFSTVGCERGRPMLWERHTTRLATSVAVLEPGVVPPLPSEAELSEFLGRQSLYGPARVRVVVFSEGPDGPWSVETSAALVAQCGPDVPPLRLLSTVWPAAPPLAEHKTLARLPWDKSRRAAQRAGADDALMTEARGRVLETSVANVFVRRGDTVVTPPVGGRCLPGIMRQWLIEHFDAVGLEVVEEDVTVDEVYRADEVWLSNAIIGVRRVGAVDQQVWRRWDRFPDLRKLGVPAPGWSG